MVQRPQETLRQLCAIFPAFESSWADEGSPAQDGLVAGVHYEWSHHAVLSNFLECFSMNCDSFTEKQFRAFSDWVNSAVSVPVRQSKAQIARLVARDVLGGELVEPVGIEPTTSSMPWKRSPS